MLLSIFAFVHAFKSSLWISYKCFIKCSDLHVAIELSFLIADDSGQKSVVAITVLLRLSVPNASSLFETFTSCICNQKCHQKQLSISTDISTLAQKCQNCEFGSIFCLKSGFTKVKLWLCFDS